MFSKEQWWCDLSWRMDIVGQEVDSELINQTNDTPFFFFIIYPYKRFKTEFYSPCISALSFMNIYPTLTPHTHTHTSSERTRTHSRGTHDIQHTYIYIFRLRVHGYRLRRVTRYFLFGI